tara:strand:- start:1162 stop:1524 length:363 start_codon:yes stop_codon:yes gene_type:complete
MNEELVGNLASRIAREYELPNEVRRTSDPHIDTTITVSSNDNIYNQDGFYSSNGSVFAATISANELAVLGSGGGGVDNPNTIESLSEKIDRLEKKIDKLTTMMDLKLDSKTLDLLDDLTL